MTTSTCSTAILPEPRIYQAMDFKPAAEGPRPYSLHIVAAFDHADAVSRLRAADLIGEETYVLTDEEQQRGPAALRCIDKWNHAAPTVAEQLGWVEVMRHEVREHGMLLRGPSWVRVAP